MTPKIRKLAVKTIIFILSLSLAWYILKSGSLNLLIEKVLPVMFLAEFLAGCFYAFFLTSPLSIAMFVILAQKQNPILLAIVAGLGSALVDLMIVKFFRKEVNQDLNLLAKSFRFYLINKVLSFFKLDLLLPIIGAIIVASPLPDELGLFLLGASKLKFHQIFLLSFILNTAGILLVVLPINLLS